MSWDAGLFVVVDGHDLGVGDWNYTHNCNRMISTALEDAGKDLGEPHWLIGHMGKSWFDLLNGCSASDGAELLTEVIARFEANPDKFKAMNPENGWGDFESLLGVLKEMRDRALDYPSGLWGVTG